MDNRPSNVKNWKLKSQKKRFRKRVTAKKSLSTLGALAHKNVETLRIIKFHSHLPAMFAGEQKSIAIYCTFGKNYAKLAHMSLCWFVLGFLFRKKEWTVRERKCSTHVRFTVQYCAKTLQNEKVQMHSNLCRDFHSRKKHWKYNDAIVQ